MQEHILWNYSRKQKRKGLPEEVVAFDLPKMSRHKSIVLSGHAKPIKYKRAGSTPVSQIIPDSSLGVALREITMNNNLPSSSEPDSSSDQESDYSREDRPHRRRQLRKRPSQKTGSPTIRLIPPKEYDGSADARAYHWFLMEGNAYLKDGKIHEEDCKIRILAHFLDGKVYAACSSW